MPQQLNQVSLIELALTATTVSSALTSEQTFIVPGLKLNDFVTVQKEGTAQTGLGLVNARVSAENTLAITFMNANAGTEVVPTTAAKYKIRVERPSDYKTGVQT